MTRVKIPLTAGVYAGASRGRTGFGKRLLYSAIAVQPHYIGQGYLTCRRMAVMATVNDSRACSVRTAQAYTAASRHDIEQPMSGKYL